MDERYTLKKEERLSSKDGLDALLSAGNYGREKVLKYCYRRCNSLPFNRIVVSVPKKFFRRAVWRNLLKRRIREAYRLNKHILRPAEIREGEEKWGGTDILFIYSTKEVMNQEQVNAMVVSILKNLASHD
ncbi:MAG: ribonuclease P protein component [Candidatus Cryptobacteroides sp.]